MLQITDEYSLRGLTPPLRVVQGYHNCMTSLESKVKEQARMLGFELVGIVPATQADGLERMREWLDQGYAGEMDYMHRQAEARRHPDSILPEVRSVVMVGMNYKEGVRGQGSGVRGGARSEGRGASEATSRSSEGDVSSLAPRPSPLFPPLVARYARGEDYHHV